ncbi:MAG TPA: outer membrane beta-barrel protein [Bacteriovoracaceae bacterium]|nr:outer membrane beta-barrel protein [Bacteriovoracaceae bacterium]
MKTRNLLVLALSLSFASAYAQSEEQVLNSDPINVDGYLHEDRPVTDGELEQIRGELRKQKNGTQLNKEKSKDLGKLSQQTEKLLDSQDEYIDSKIESAEAIKEFNKKNEENQKKLRCIMEESDDRECDAYKGKYSRNKQPVVQQEIQMTQAYPVVSNGEVGPMGNGGVFERIKLIPYIGGTSYSGKVESLEATVAGGLRLESNINSRFSLGLGINYAQLKTNDFANNSQYMNQSYYGAYGRQGREIQFSTMGLDLYGKFFITNGERFRPYVGAGIGYNRGSLKYSENTQYSSQQYGQFGNEDFKTSYVAGTLMAGSEIMITSTVGMNIEAAYSTGLGDSLSSQGARNSFSSPDQRRLQQLGEELVNANAMSIFAGMVIIF